MNGDEPISALGWVTRTDTDKSGCSEAFLLSCSNGTPRTPELAKLIGLWVGTHWTNHSLPSPPLLIGLGISNLNWANESQSRNAFLSLGFRKLSSGSRDQGNYVSIYAAAVKMTAIVSIRIVFSCKSKQIWPSMA